MATLTSNDEQAARQRSQRLQRQIVSLHLSEAVCGGEATAEDSNEQKSQRLLRL